MKCWWCGSKADSREHIFKKTDIRRAYGDPPYDPAVMPLIKHGESMKYVQGPDSKHLKFRANLCHKCNTARSSDFDRAYDVFIEGAPAQILQIVRANQIDLNTIGSSNTAYGSFSLEKNKDGSQNIGTQNLWPSGLRLKQFEATSPNSVPPPGKKVSSMAVVKR
jgi:hypothetical protein